MGLIGQVSSKSYRVCVEPFFEREVARPSGDIFGKVKGHTNKLLRTIAALMHHGSLSCCQRIKLKDSRDNPHTEAELMSGVQE